MTSVRLEDPESMNLLGLLLRSLIQRNLEDPACQRRAERLRGDVAVRAGRMSVTVRFGDAEVVVTRAPAARPRARVGGTLAGLLEVALGRGLVRAWLRRRISASGNLFFVLRLLPLIRAREAA